MIINIEALDTPKEIDIDEVIKAAYLGLTISELSKRLGVDPRMLGRWVALHFPQYAKVRKATEESRRAIERWKLFLERVEFKNLPEGMQRFIGFTFPPYVWAKDDELYDYTWLRKMRRVLWNDRKLIEMYIDRMRGGEGLHYAFLKKTFSTYDKKIYDLMFGLIDHGSDEWRKAIRAYGELMAERGGLRVKKFNQGLSELRRLWLSKAHGEGWTRKVRRSSFVVCEEGPERWGLRLAYSRRQKVRGRYWYFRQFSEYRNAQRIRKDQGRGGIRRRPVRNDRDSNN